MRSLHNLIQPEETQPPLPEVRSEAIISKALLSAKWSYLAYIVTRLIQAVAPLVYAKILLPEDFGVMATGLLMVNLVLAIQNTGFSKALVQTDRDPNECANVIFWMSLFVSVCAYVAIYAFSPFVTQWFGDSRLTSVLRIIGLLVIIGAFDAVQVALLERDFKYKALSARRVIPALVPLLVGWPLALYGFGPWALVIGTISGASLGVVATWGASKWRPRFRFQGDLLPPLLSFGAIVTIESVVVWSINYGDNIVIGSFFGTRALGLYTFAFNMVVLVMSCCLGPVTSIAYAAFSRLKDQARFTEAFLKCTQLIAAINIPLSGGLFLLGPAFVRAYLDANWHELGWILGVFSLMPGLSYLWMLIPEAFKAKGKPFVMLKVQLATLLYIVVVYSIAVQYGLKWLVFARASIGIVFAPVHIYLSIKELKFPPKYLWTATRGPIFCTMIMTVVILSAKVILKAENITALGLYVFLGAVSYIISIFVFCPEVVRLAYKVLRSGSK